MSHVITNLPCGLNCETSSDNYGQTDKGRQRDRVVAQANLRRMTVKIHCEPRKEQRTKLKFRDWLTTNGSVAIADGVHLEDATSLRHLIKRVVQGLEKSKGLRWLPNRAERETNDV